MAYIVLYGVAIGAVGKIGIGGLDLASNTPIRVSIVFIISVMRISYAIIAVLSG